MSNITATANDVYDSLSDYSHLLSISNIKELVDNRIRDWGKDVSRSFMMDYPHWNTEQVFTDLSEKEKNVVNYHDMLKLNQSVCEQVDLTFNPFWSQEVAKFNKQKRAKNNVDNRDFKSSYQLLKNETQELIAKRRLNWELVLLSEKRAELLKILLSKLEMLDELFSIVDSLGIEPGVLLDLSEGELTQTDMSVVKRWLKYLKDDQGIQDLLSLMGRLNQIKRSEKIKIVKKTISQRVTIPDINSKEEIVGIKLGKDLEHALPSELALMGDDEASILFDLKYVESGLMCFDMEGIQHVDEKHVINFEQSVEEKDQKGPMVICIDTSGSMQGAPETIAKAITMSMVLQANQEKRDCYLINFSTSIKILDLSNGFSMKKLVYFLEMSFYGGTDVAPAITHGISVMKKDKYKNADMLIISDFIMHGLPKPQLEEIELLRNKGNKFNSLVVDTCFMEHQLKTVFDNEWVYDPSTSSIIELIKFVNLAK